MNRKGVLVALMISVGSACANPPEAVTRDAAAFDAGLDAAAADASLPFDSRILDVGAIEEPLADASLADANDTGTKDAMAPDAASLDASSVDTGPVDAGPETCSAEGMYRTVPCSCGGTLSQRCVGGYWTNQTMCSAVGECTPGDFETRNGMLCDVDQRTCDASCHWSSWVNVVPAGECPPGFHSCLLPAFNCDCQADCTCRPIPGCGP